jgi:type II secretory pathway pseudopilin PulG
VNNSHQPLDDLVRKAQQQQHAQEMLQQALDQALRAPFVTRRANVNAVSARRDPDGSTVLQIALPTGERWDVPLSPRARVHLARTLASQDGTEAPGPAQ